MVKFQLASDIHLEHIGKSEVVLGDILQPSADHLILAGDIGDPYTPVYRSFLQQASQAFKRVVVIAGNHEYYCHTMSEVQARLQAMQQEFPNVSFLENSCVEIDGVCVIGSTLWSHCPPSMVAALQYGLNDYNYIYTDKSNTRLTPAVTTDLFRQAVVYLQDALIKARAARQRALVVTHHLPSFRCTHPRFKGSTLNYGFASNLDHIILSGLAHTWVFGHTHESYAELVMNPADGSGLAGTGAGTGVGMHTETGQAQPCCRLLCNPFGYPNECGRQTRYDPRCTFDV